MGTTFTSGGAMGSVNALRFIVTGRILTEVKEKLEAHFLELWPYVLHKMLLAPEQCCLHITESFLHE